MPRLVDELVDVLGGSAATAEIAGVGISAVSNWKTNGVIPAAYFLVFSKEFKRRDLRLDPAIFAFRRDVA